MANTVGKISGQVLENNLIRQGEDLAFETDLIYLNVNTQRVGINTDIPFRPLVVDSTLKSTHFLIDTDLSVPNFLFSSNTILNDTDDITISATGPGSAVVALAVSTDSILINTSGIQSLRSNEDIDLTPNGLGQVVFNSKVDVDGSLHVTGNITFDGSIVIGNNDTDNFILNADLSSDLVPDITDTYALGSESKQWNTLSTILINGETLSSGGAVVGGVDISTRAGNIWYVAANGNDSNVGDHPNGPFSTIEWALGQAASGDTVYIYPGTYVELFPLVVPQGVTVSGAGIRSVKIVPDTASQYEDVFKLNGETTVEDLTVADFYYDSGLDKGYAFSFAPGFTVTSRSPYIRNVSVITRGSNAEPLIDGEYADAVASTFLDGGAAAASFSSVINGGPALYIPSISEDVLGFSAGDAGRGAFIDGSAANSSSIQATMLFQSCTFITPGVDCLVMKNGVRVEWLSSFTYYANRGLYAENGIAGFAGLGLKFGAEIRSIGSANVYGNYGAWADGDETLMYLISHNFGYIGAGGLSNNDPEDAIDANEITKLNSGRIYYESTNHIGDVKIGDIFTIRQLTGEIAFSTGFTANTSMLFVSGLDRTYIDSLEVTTGNITVSGNTISSNTGNIILNPVNDLTTVNSNLTITDDLSVDQNFVTNQNTILGTSSANSLDITATVSTNFVANNVDLGSRSLPFKNLYSVQTVLDNIVVSGNVIKTTISNSDLELRVNGTGGIIIPSDSLIVDQNLTVNGVTNLLDTVLTNLTATTVTADLTTLPSLVLDGISISGNVIQTIESNADLELRANGTGIVQVNDNLNLNQNLSVLGTTSLSNATVSNTLTLTGNLILSSYTVAEYNNEEILIRDNFITTTRSNSSLELKAAGLGGIVFDQGLKVTDSTISNTISLGTESEKSINLAPYAGVTISSTAALKIPVGDNTNRTLSTNGEIRYNPTTTTFEGRRTGGTQSLYGLYDIDRNTYISAELTPGANDNTIRMATNGVVQATITDQRVQVNTLRVDEIEINNNVIRTLNSNADIILDTSFNPSKLPITLDNPNAYSTSASDFFGSAVAVSGNYAIVGAANEDDAGGTDSGKAYIYNVTTGSLLFTLNNPNAYSTSASDSFGDAVAIDGNYAIVGAYLEDDASGSGSGKAYIYNVTTGSLLFTLNNPNPSTSDYFGSAVAISGNYAIVGAYRDATLSGKAYIFDVTTGSLLFTLTNPNPYGTTLADQFGFAVAISGNYAIVGANGEDELGGSGSGKAYIYNVTTGSLLFTLSNPNAYGTSANDGFGNAVAISGNYAIVSAPREDDAGGTDSGKAYIYNVTTGSLVYTLDNPNAYGTSASDLFGGFYLSTQSVAISGDYAVVGAYAEDDAGGTSSGKVYVFSLTTGLLVYTISNPNAYGTSTDDYFGWSVAVSGDYILVGARLEDDAGGTSSGKAYIYNIATGALNINDSFNVQTSSITNSNLNAATQIQSTGSGYVKFSDETALQIPSGTNAEQPAAPPIGASRWNIDESYLEVWDGSNWVTASGGGATVSAADMGVISDTFSLIFG